MANIKKTVSKRKKKVGRGYGSGVGGHTVGRGQKGQKSRGGLSVLFEGVKTKKSFYKRLPLLRGKGKFHAKPKPYLLSMEDLSSFKSGDKVTLEELVKKEIITETDAKKGVKLLANGEVSKKLVLQIPASKGAVKLIEKAGGEVKKDETKSSKAETKSNA